MLIRDKQIARYFGQIGKRVHDLRTKADLSQRELARRAGVSWDTISRIEKGHGQGISFENLLRIQAALGLPSIEDLVEDRGPTLSGTLGSRLIAASGKGGQTRPAAGGGKSVPVSSEPDKET